MKLLIGKLKWFRIEFRAQIHESNTKKHQNYELKRILSMKWKYAEGFSVQKSGMSFKLTTFDEKFSKIALDQILKV